MKYEKRIMKALRLITLFVIIVGVPCLVFKEQKAKSISAVSLFKNIDFRKVSRTESDYLTLGWDIIDRFSAKSTRYSMSKEQRIKFLTANWKLSQVFGRGCYDVPIIGILEGALNPHQKHELYGEMGMFGQWPSTAKYYYYMAKDIMPSRLFSWVKFDFQKPTDLLDPINSLKMAYIFLWIEGYNYGGDEMWTISAYRWGRFIGKHWLDKGNCEFPTRFIIYTKYGKKQYNPRAYYWTWRNMRDSFEKGDLNTGLEVYKKYAKKRDRLKTEEIEFRRLYRVMKSQEKTIRELNEFATLMKHQSGIDLKKKKTEIKVLKQISGVAKKEGWTKKTFKKVRDFCRGKLK